MSKARPSGEEDATPVGGAPRLTGPALAAVAGAADAVGLVLTQRYTAHMSGTTSTTASALVRGDARLIELGACALVCFTTGAAVCSFTMRHLADTTPAARLRRLLAIEAGVITLAMTSGLIFHRAEPSVFLLVGLLAFAMGFQNNLSKRGLERGVRTTHVTGALTDLGGGLGATAHALFAHERPEPKAVGKARIAAVSFLAFLIGGVGGCWCALGFGAWALLLPLSAVAVLIVLGVGGS
jgi:uncharacterized membrane protein YoaK (UPF0700 family)